MAAAPQPPPTKANLKAWWNHFTATQKHKKEDKDETEHAVFGKPLRDSLRYASVQISTVNVNGELYVWGYIPVVVAKCGLFLKENATEVQGVFRVNGSNKRMRELQAKFEKPPRYGKNLEWKKEEYTVHDVASVFRRYLTQMPEPVIPHDLYHSFRDALAKRPYDQDKIIATYKRLIRSMPRGNQYLLLYVLDLLSVFARKADKNLMTAQNLAVIFRPGLISHPNHEMSPQEHRLSQEVLEFLIAHQDHFMLNTPAPTPSEPGSPVQEDTHARRSSDDHDSVVTDDWRLVERPERRKSTRRKTTEDGPSGSTPVVKGGVELMTVAEDSQSPAHEKGITRRRTIPMNSVPPATRRGSGNVLRKPRRVNTRQGAESTESA